VIGLDKKNWDFWHMDWNFGGNQNRRLCARRNLLLISLNVSNILLN